MITLFHWFHGWQLHLLDIDIDDLKFEVRGRPVSSSFLLLFFFFFLFPSFFPLFLLFVVVITIYVDDTDKVKQLSIHRRTTSHLPSTSIWSIYHYCVTLLTSWSIGPQKAVSVNKKTPKKNDFVEILSTLSINREVSDGGSNGQISADMSRIEALQSTSLTYSSS